MLADVARRALRKLEAVDAALQVSDLKVPPGNQLHALKGDRAGQHAISVNDQWREARPLYEAVGVLPGVHECDEHIARLGVA